MFTLLFTCKSWLLLDNLQDSKQSLHFEHHCTTIETGDDACMKM